MVGGGGRQRDLSAPVPRPALGLTGAAEDWGPASRATPALATEPGYSTCVSKCVFEGGK